VLEKQIVARPRRWRRAVPRIAAVAACGAAVFAASQWLAPRTPVVVVAPAVIPPPVVRVEVPPPPAPPAPPPAPEPPPAPAPPPPAPPPAPGTTCAVDPSTIGVPVRDDEYIRSERLTVHASAHGCTIAALTDKKLYVSWDGGQTFAEYAMTEPYSVAVSSGRVALLRNLRDLGVVRPGETEITWRSVPAFVRREGGVDPAANTATEIEASGAWTVMLQGRLIMATDDDGQTWRYLTAPINDARIVALDLDGRLTVGATVPVRPPTEEEKIDGGPIPNQTLRYQTRIIGGRWRPLPALPGRLTASTQAWSYLRDTDRFWGCGSSEKIVAVRGDKQLTIGSDLRDEVWHVSIAANDDVAFAGLNQKLYRVTGGRSEEVADLPGEDPVVAAIDGRGMPLAVGYSGLLRWSPRGGWRRLLLVPVPAVE
jgi:hypothetical protein